MNTADEFYEDVEKKIKNPLDRLSDRQKIGGSMALTAAKGGSGAAFLHNQGKNKIIAGERLKSAAKDVNHIGAATTMHHEGDALLREGARTLGAAKLTAAGTAVGTIATGAYVAHQLREKKKRGALVKRDFDTADEFYETVEKDWSEWNATRKKAKGVIESDPQWRSDYRKTAAGAATGIAGVGIATASALKGRGGGLVGGSALAAGGGGYELIHANRANRRAHALGKPIWDEHKAAKNKSVAAKRAPDVEAYYEEVEKDWTEWNEAHKKNKLTPQAKKGMLWGALGGTLGLGPGFGTAIGAGIGGAIGAKRHTEDKTRKLLSELGSQLDSVHSKLGDQKKVIAAHKKTIANHKERLGVGKRDIESPFIAKAAGTAVVLHPSRTIPGGVPMKPAVIKPLKQGLSGKAKLGLGAAALLGTGGVALQHHKDATRPVRPVGKRDIESPFIAKSYGSSTWWEDDWDE